MLRSRPLRLLAVLLALVATGCATAYTKGASQLRAERYTDAARYFEEALQKDPENWDALVGLGIARYGEGNWDAAISDLGRVVARVPRRADALLYLGLATLQNGDVASAEQHLRAYWEVADSPRIRRQVDEALRLLRSDTPPSQETRRYIAASIETAVKSEEAIREAHRRRPPGPWLYDPLFDDPLFWGWGYYPSAFVGPRCFVTRHGRIACF